MVAPFLETDIPFKHLDEIHHDDSPSFYLILNMLALIYLKSHF